MVILWEQLPPITCASIGELKQFSWGALFGVTSNSTSPSQTTLACGLKSGISGLICFRSTSRNLVLFHVIMSEDCNMLTNIIEIERLSFAGAQEKNTMRLVKSWDVF